MATLNFNKIPKKYLTVTLNDENKTVLMIGNPTKRLLTEMITLNLSNENKDSNNGNEEEEVSQLYEVCSKIMTRNKGGVVITKELLESIFDIEDVMIFLKAYMDFVSEQTKN